MIIEKKPLFIRQIKRIIRYIAKDKISPALKFEKELNKKLQEVKDFPYLYRASYYFNDEAYRDLVHMGYTVIYKVEADKILVLEIFKWVDRA